MCTRKSHEREILIEFTWCEGAKIMNKAHLMSSFVYYKEKCLSDIGEPAVSSYERETFKQRFDLNCSDHITTTQGRIKISGFFTCITSQLIYCISCHKRPGVVYIRETGIDLATIFGSTGWTSLRRKWPCPFCGNGPPAGGHVSSRD